ncbi:MAG: phosphoribosylamine--glycine ligase [Desulfovibrionaceae bacterium]|nr:phosphoribosylamine--glycine ligase [Desulfovibrionaceae bacterium]
MRILIVGSGGREHALAWKLKQSPLVERLYIAPGNGGTALEGTNVPIKDDDLPGIVTFAKEKGIDLVVAGPELPLVLGLADALATESIPCFGPDAYSAQLEGSKAFAKTIMRESGVPTADFRVFDDPMEAKDYLNSIETPIVVKADGLAAGKGVIVAKTREEALAAVDDIMVKKVFGSAGDHVVIEEALRGEEASFLAFCDGETVVPLPSSQDHKAVGEGDTGPNTGGMGAYSPAPILPRADYEKTADLVLRPIIKTLKAKGSNFVGMLYAGLMYTDKGPYVLEYNVRFGDPECQPLLMRLESDLAEIMLACVKGRLKDVEVTYTKKTAMCVVMAAKGYPGSYPKGMPISGIADAETLGDVKIFQAGTRIDNDRTVTSGGRVLGVTALGESLKTAQALAYKAVDKVHFENAYIRRDIGDKGLKY